MNDLDRFEIMEKRLYSGVLCDVMDELGLRDQAMNERLRPLDVTRAVAGRAKTILAVDVYYVHEDTYDVEIASLDSIKPGEVAVVCTNRSVNNGVWGELLSTAAKMRGGRGAIVDGLIRDTKKIRELGFPVFCTGCKPVDSRGRGKVVEYDCVVECGDIRVSPGDVIFGDADGVCVIPKDRFEQVFELALEKVEKENHTRDELLEGRLLREVFEKYGVL